MWKSDNRQGTKLKLKTLIFLVAIQGPATLHPLVKTLYFLAEMMLVKSNCGRATEPPTALYLLQTSMIMEVVTVFPVIPENDIGWQYSVFTAQNDTNGRELWALDPQNVTLDTPPLKISLFDFKLQVLDQLYPIFPSEDSADLAIDEPMVNITFQYDLKSAGTMVNQNIALTHRATCAIVENGSVACWGRGQLYSLGNGGDANTGEPILTSPMPDNRPAVAISAGGWNVCALLDNGSVACWGSANMYGEMGNGDQEQHVSPELTNITGDELYATSISVAYTSACAILDNGSVSCWGNNQWGQVGDNSTTHRFSPTFTFPFADGKKATAITSGTHNHCALLDDGTVSCWGRNSYGNLGDNTTNSSNVPYPPIRLADQLLLFPVIKTTPVQFLKMVQ
ncbi:MAG: hypothetical protein CM15mP42_04170 [Methanobacteriota archaeon]|nr:MAG: hypothetical protein CM15mP42_04170 [Euryarchaeota archaeon]